jgi:hypothetical protein
MIKVWHLNSNIQQSSESVIANLNGQLFHIEQHLLLHILRVKHGSHVSRCDGGLNRLDLEVHLADGEDEALEILCRCFEAKKMSHTCHHKMHGKSQVC